jgi:hypothetical protein
MDLASMRKLLSLRREIRSLDEQMKKARAEEERLEDAVAQGLVAEGIQNMSLDGMTVYLSTALYCTKKGDGDAVATARELGLDDFIEEVVQPQRVKAWARERIEQARAENPAATASDALPQSFLDTFHVHERTCIGSRKSSNAGAKT